MRLSRKATKFLRYLSKHTEFRYYYQLEKDYPGFDEQTFWAIFDAGYFEIHPHVPLPKDIKLDVELYGYDLQYRINEKGYAYLESISKETAAEHRARLEILLTIASLAFTIYAFFNVPGCQLQR